MARDVEFRLAVTRDPQSKNRAKQFERDLTGIQSDHQEKRKRTRKKTEREIGQERRRHVSQERDATKQVLRVHKDSLNKQHREYKLFTDKRKQLTHQELVDFKRAEKARRDELKKTTLLGRAKQGSRGSVGGGSGGGLGAVGAGALGGRLAGAAGAVGVTLGAAGAFAGARAAVGIQSDLEQQRLRLEAMTGSAREAARAFDMLRSISGRLGLPQSEVEGITALLKNYGFSLDEAAERTVQLGAITGGASQEMFRIAEAMGEASRFGKITEETLKKMESSGFNPLLAISQKTGESLQSLTKRAFEGELAFSAITDAMDDMVKKGGSANEMLGKLEQSTESKLTRAKNQWIDFGEAVGDAAIALGLVEAAGATGGMLASSAKGYTAAATGTSVERAMAVEMEKARRVRSGDNMIGTGASDIALRALDLNEQIAKLQERRQQKQDQHEQEMQRREERRKNLARERLETGSQEIIQARQLNKERLEGARKELETRKQALAAAKSATQEARQGLMSAQERFGAMSTEEQREVLGTLQRARGDVRSLGVDDIQQLQSLGTKEAQALSSRALRFRASAAFGDSAMTPEQEARRRQLRSSVFAGERQAIRRAEHRETRVEANVEQQIKFVAQFEQTSDQVSRRIWNLMQEAIRQENDEVLQKLKAIQDENAVIKRRLQAQTPGRGF